MDAWKLSLIGLVAAPTGSADPDGPAGTRFDGARCAPIDTDAGPDGAVGDGGDESDAAAMDGTVPNDASVDCSSAVDGTACGSGAICPGGSSAPSRCGDGFVDVARGEPCEDGNETGGDGCEPVRCRFSSENDEECGDSNPCTADSCDASAGCVHALVDGDGDGFAPGSCPAGTPDGDCDDSADGVYPGAAELCDSVDNDCDDTVDEDPGVPCLRDEDGDGFGDPTDTMEARTCPAGYIPERAGGRTDCNDSTQSIPTRQATRRRAPRATGSSATMTGTATVPKSGGGPPSRRARLARARSCWAGVAETPAGNPACPTVELPATTECAAGPRARRTWRSVHRSAADGTAAPARGAAVCRRVG